MVDVYDIYNEVLSKVNKEENGYLTATLFNSYARAANRLVFNDYNTRLQNPQTASVEKLKLEDRLAPFEMMAILSAQAGAFTVPTNYAYFRATKIKGDGSNQAVIDILKLTEQLCAAAEDPTINVADIQRQLNELTATAGLVSVTLLDHDQVAKRINSYVPGKKPSLKKPIMERATINAIQGYQVYPAVDLTIFLSYYRRPALTTLVMTPTQPTMTLQYSPPPVSVGFEWGEEAMGDVVNKIVTDFSVYIREGGLFQMTQAEAKP